MTTSERSRGANIGGECTRQCKSLKKRYVLVYPLLREAGRLLKYRVRFYDTTTLSICARKFFGNFEEYGQELFFCHFHMLGSAFQLQLKSSFFEFSITTFVGDFSAFSGSF